MQHYPRRGTFFAVMRDVARTSLHQRRNHCEHRGLAAPGVSAWVVLLEAPSDEKETVWVASWLTWFRGVEILLDMPKPLPSFYINTMIPLERRTGRCRSWTSSVGCIVFFPDLFLVVVLPFTRCYWVRTARVVNYLASFEDLVLIEALAWTYIAERECIPTPLNSFALWLQKGVQANLSITTTSSKQTPVACWPDSEAAVNFHTRMCQSFVFAVVVLLVTLRLVILCWMFCVCVQLLCVSCVLLRCCCIIWKNVFSENGANYYTENGKLLKIRFFAKNVVEQYNTRFQIENHNQS
jgi:hypothetical protein